MRRKALSTSFIILATVIFGLGGIGYSVYLPQDVIDTVSNQIQETDTVTKADVIDTHLRESYLEDAMNWSVYASVYRFGKEPHEVKEWSEKSIAGPQELEDNLTAQASEDFRNWYLGEEDIPEGCSISSEPFDFIVDDRYAVFRGDEGANITVESPAPVEVTCSTDTGSNRVLIPPPELNRSYETRFFHMYNLTQNLTSDDRFRFRVEGAAMNVSKYLRLESDPSEANCEPSDGDGTNTVGSEPYNDGPDCTPNRAEFEPGTPEFEDTVRAAEDKYEDEVAGEVEDSLETVENRFEDPGDWEPKGVESRFDDVEVDIEVETLDYRIFNVRRNYTDRKVDECTQSHSYTYRVATASAESSTSGDSCAPCDFDSYPEDCHEDCGETLENDCGESDCRQCEEGTCDEKCDTCTSSSVYVKEDSCNAGCGTDSDIRDEVNEDFGCGCSDSDTNVYSCDTPDWFPVWEEPKASVADGNAESDDGEFPDAVGKSSNDCIGAREYSDDGEYYQGDSCNLDNACQADSDGWRAEVGSRAGDATDYSDEEGSYRKCSNTGDIYSGIDNPWNVSIEKDGAAEREDGFWQDGRFEQRLFMEDYSGVVKTVSADRMLPSIRPMDTLERGAPITFVQQDGGPPACTLPACPAEGECTIDDSCEYDYSASCEIEITESSYTDRAYENEVVHTIGNYKFDLKAYVRLKITVTDERYKIPTKDGLKHPEFVTYYDQYAISTFEEGGTDSVSSCDPSAPFDPDG